MYACCVPRFGDFLAEISLVLDSKCFAAANCSCSFFWLTVEVEDFTKTQWHDLHPLSASSCIRLLRIFVLLGRLLLFSNLISQVGRQFKLFFRNRLRLIVHPALERFHTEV